MSTTSQEHVATSHWESDPGTSGAASKCQGRLQYDPSAPALVCSECATRLPIENDILIAKEQTSDNNQVAQEFYDSPLWPKFRFWEKFTWFCNGGERRARNKVLRHLPDTPGPRPARRGRSATASISTGCRPTGESSASTSRAPSSRPAAAARPADRSGWPRAKPRSCRSRASSSTPCSEHRCVQLLQRSRGRPARDDPRGSPGAPIVISDEVPNLTDRMLGHKLGIPGASIAGSSRTDAPRRFVHRDGRTSSRSRRPGDRRPRVQGVSLRARLVGRRLCPGRHAPPD